MHHYEPSPNSIEIGDTITAIPEAQDIAHLKAYDTPIQEFVKAFPIITGINMQKDYVTYKSNYASQVCIDANILIDKLKLPLVAVQKWNVVTVAYKGDVK